MKLVIQRVNHASVTVEGKVTGEIQKGYLVLLGVGQGDDESMVERYVKKLHKLRGCRRRGACSITVYAVCRLLKR